jgi:ABC transporter substrate binding protein
MTMWGSTIRGIVTLILSLLTVPLTSQAQPAAQVPRLGLLMPSSFSAVASRIEAFRHGLRTLGYVEGQNITLESRVAALWHRDAPMGPYVKETQAAAQALGLQLHALAGRRPDEFDEAFAAMPSAPTDALVVLPSAPCYRDQRVAAWAMTPRWPTLCGLREGAAAGGRLSDGPPDAAFYRRAATDVPTIRPGAKPADLAVAQARQCAFVINLKPAKALGLTLPPPLRYGADEVREEAGAEALQGVGNRRAGRTLGVQATPYSLRCAPAIGRA